MSMTQIPYKIIQDFECDWYWIPIHEIERFNHFNNALSGKDYMDDPDKFELFTDLFNKYKTGGDPNNCPDYWKDKILPQ